MDLIPRNITLSGFNLIWLWEKLDELPGLFALLVDSIVNAEAPAPTAAAAAAATGGSFGTAATTADTVRSSLASMAGAVASAASAGVPLSTANPSVHALLQSMPPKALAAAISAAKAPGPHVGKTFSFVQLPAALAYLQSGKSVGKVVVTLSENDAKKLHAIAIATE
jgi:hypothetical protein